MLKAPIPENEPERLESLKQLKLLDTGIEERFDRITKVAQRVFDVPISTLSLIDSKREWFKSCQGLDATEGLRAISFCGHAMLANDLFVVPDTLEDDRFKDNPMVIGKPHIRFYAGQSVLGPGGHKIGTLCIKDYKPRVYSNEHLKTLKDLTIWTEIELNAKELTRVVYERRENEKRLSNLVIQLQKAQEEVKHAQLQVLQSEKLASIGQLAAGIAHEINNPIGFISNNMEILGQYVGQYIKVLRMIEGLKKSVDEENLVITKAILKDIEQFGQEIHLNQLINDTGNLLDHNRVGIERIKKIILDLRTFSREDSGLMEFIKIEEIIDSILNITQNELKFKAEIKKNYGNTPPVKCNAQKLGQVFINLFINASQAIEEKGTIEIKTYQEAGSLCVDVSDTGKGIPHDNLKRVFDAFFTTKPVGQGTGLGLSVSYEIVKKHGGDIKVRSKLGKGTTFTVMLPLTEKSK